MISQKCRTRAAVFRPSQEKIFELYFTKGKQRWKRNRSGANLPDHAMALCSVEFDSIVGAGTTFRLACQRWSRKPDRQAEMNGVSTSGCWEEQQYRALLLIAATVAPISQLQSNPASSADQQRMLEHRFDRKYYPGDSN